MRHPTDMLKKLKMEIRQAGKIVAGVPTTGSVTPLHHLKVQSFILLSHAAFEQYLEELGRQIARDARRQFKAKGRISKVLVTLMTAKALDDVADKARKRVTEDIVHNLDVFSELALSRYEKMLGDNHGICEQNQKNILLPIGVDPEMIDTSLMNTLNAFGKMRGTIAHTFAMVRTEHTLSDVNATLSLILGSIGSFDQAACSALKLGMAKSS
ncbi:HEPN domain-containing protein [Hyphomicrobium sp. MC1]|uniref:HEPN domain-containing protein n=1 Tax=Hyphomicrobium sp. (strain MC1) TaxID=717785 RepID=UPI000213D311|nr:HEPN domain-containing protein [Hyphomicrobium sp. MC1]CCB64303.1 protein of unknown function [Hyphomicrobium sp. MC1]